MTRAHFTRVSKPEKEIRYGRDMRPIDPSERRRDAEPTHTAGDSVLLADLDIEKQPEDAADERLDTKRMIDALEDDKQPFSCERYMDAIEAERRNAEWQKRFEVARDYLRRPITARELDATLSVIKPHPALDGDDNG